MKGPSEVAALYEVGHAMSDYRATLHDAIDNVQNELAYVDEELNRARRILEKEVDEQCRDSDRNTDTDQLRTMKERLEVLARAEEAYHDAGDGIRKMLVEESHSESDGTAVGALAKLAQALEAYYRVPLLESLDADDGATQYVLTQTGTGQTKQCR